MRTDQELLETDEDLSSEEKARLFTLGNTALIQGLVKKARQGKLAGLPIRS